MLIHANLVEHHILLKIMLVRKYVLQGSMEIINQEPVSHVNKDVYHVLQHILVNNVLMILF